SILPRHRFQHAGLILDPPRDMQFVSTLSFCSERLAIQEQFNLIAVEICPDIDVLVVLPIPVRQKMQHWFVGPLALIHVIGVFWKTSEIDNAEVGTDGGPWIGSRLADVIPSGPDKHAGNPIVLLDEFPCFFVCRAPW